MDNQYNGEENRQMVLTQSFWQLQKAIMTQVKQTAVDNDLSVPQFTILLMMQQKGQMPQKKLQARTHFPKSTLSHAIDGLVQDGILERTHVKGNRREMDLSLSERGIALIDQIRSQHNSVHVRFKEAVDSFTEEEFNQLIQMQEHIVAYFNGGEAE